MPRKATKLIKLQNGDEIVANEEYYLNNQNLPKDGSTYEITPEMALDMKRSKDDIIYFAQNHFFVNGMYGKEKIRLFKKQKKILSTIHDNKKTILSCSRQSGKCLSINELCRFRHKKSGIVLTLPIGIFYYTMKIKKFFAGMKISLLSAKDNK